MSVSKMVITMLMLTRWMKSGCLTKFNLKEYPDLPDFVITGVPRFGTPTDPGPDQHTNSVTVRDMVSYQHGRHSLRFGADIRWYQFNYNQAYGAY
jgi:hypothetical protein